MDVEKDKLARRVLHYLENGYTVPVPDALRLRASVWSESGVPLLPLRDIALHILGAAVSAEKSPTDTTPAG